MTDPDGSVIAPSTVMPPAADRSSAPPMALPTAVAPANDRVPEMFAWNVPAFAKDMAPSERLDPVVVKVTVPPAAPAYSMPTFARLELLRLIVPPDE